MPSRRHAIGQRSNDLTQLMLGVDRDNELFGADYDERDKAVLAAIHSIITECRRLGFSCSICGQARLCIRSTSTVWWNGESTRFQ